MRRLLELITQPFVVRRRLPPAFGRAPIYVSSEGGLKFLLRSSRNWDAALLRYADEFVHPGSVVWDVGANVGLFTLAAAQRAGNQGAVISIEADISLIPLLRRTAAAQPDKHAAVRILPCAVSDSVSIRTFCIAARARAANHLEGYGSTQTGGLRDKQDILSVTLDWLLERLPHPSVVKIDVEGAEAEVLRGADRLLATARPIVICEVSSQNAVAVAALFAARDYFVYDADIGMSSRRRLDAAPWATLALPVERAAQVVPANR